MTAEMRRAAILVLASFVAACDHGASQSQQKPAQPRTWPAGTVLAVDDTLITSEEIDAVSVYTERIEPQSSAPQLRRLALTNIVLPRVLSRLMAPQEREKALEEAQSTLTSIKNGTLVLPLKPDGAYGEMLTVGWPQLGILPWGIAMDLDDGAWSEVIEDVGRFVLLKRVKRIDAPLPMATQVQVDVLAFPWLPVATMRVDVEQEHDKHKLTIVDPAWNEIVPELIKYRMGVHTP